MSRVASAIRGWALDSSYGRYHWDVTGTALPESWQLTLSRVAPWLAHAILEARQARPDEWEWAQHDDSSGSLSLAVTREEALAIRRCGRPLDVLLPPNTLVARVLRPWELLA